MKNYKIQMRKNAIIHVRINQNVKDLATEVLEKIGLTPSSAFQLMMIKIAAEGSLPFDPYVPKNDITDWLRAAED